MDNTSNDTIWIIRSISARVRHFFATLTFICVTLALVYLIYWGLVETEQMIYDYTAKYFIPLASVFNKDATQLDAFGYTSLCLFILSLVFLFFHTIVDNIKTILINNEVKLSEIKLENLKKQQKIKAKKDYIVSLAKSYSICLSLEYENSSLSDIVKSNLNKTIFSNFEKKIRKTNLDVELNYTNVLIISSANFYTYDNVYDKLLKYLAFVKKTLANKNLSIIPSITTDGYSKSMEINEIVRNHFEMKGCNFKNRAITTNRFCQKYQYINKNKYVGIPIGEYAVSSDNEAKTFELNIIYKNLNNALSQIPC